MTTVNVNNGERCGVSFGSYVGPAGVTRSSEGPWRVCFVASRKAVAGATTGIVDNTPVRVLKIGTSDLVPSMVELLVEPC